MSKRPPEAEKENHERWVISYADLITLLLGFFIILYSTAQIDLTKFEQLSVGLSQAFNVGVKDGTGEGSAVLDGGRGILPGPINTGNVDADLELLRQALGAQAGLPLQGSVQVDRVEDGIVIRLADQLLFSSASADLRPDALPILELVGDLVAGFPNEVRIEGHTDNVPLVTDNYPSNWELSSARATAVLRYLTEQRGVDPARTYAAGYGEHRPIAANDTPEGRALNRRADVVLIYPPAQIAPIDPSTDGLRPGNAMPELGTDGSRSDAADAPVTHESGTQESGAAE